jgi:hypothetical protein
MAKNKHNRTPEGEMRIGALQVARSKSGGYATTTEIKSEIHNFVNLTPEDYQMSQKRPGEEMYLQIVGNVVSHKASNYSLFNRGYAILQPDGLTITPAGLARLVALGL